MDTPQARRSGWAITDRWMRLLHLYTGIFLVPWMVIYALSALFLNHGETFRTLFKVEPPQWQQVREIDWQPPADAPTDQAARIGLLLEAVGLDGAWRIEGKPTPQELRVLRISGSGNYRVIWQRRDGTVRVEKQSPGSLYRFVHFLHFRAGYGLAYTPFLIWAAVVDLVAASILFWVISGIYLWLRQPRQRKWGSVAFLGGLILFGVLAWLLYH